MKLGREIARFEQQEWGNRPHGRVYMISLRESGATLYRANNLDTPKITAAWRHVRGWAVKFKTFEAARADYIKRGYVEVTSNAQPRTT